MRILRDVVRVSGPDAAAFLQGQLSQDVAALGTGDTAWSLILQPQGKVDALVRVTRDADDGFSIDVDAGFGDAVVSRLERFKLRIDAEIVPRGATPFDVDATAGSIALSPAVEDPPPSWREEWDALRVRLGVPAMGRELTADTIPEEAGVVDASVSFTKGCYTGQELVARIDSRGRNVPRRLRRIVLADGSGSLTEGDELVLDGRVVGTVTTASGAAGLGYAGRAVQPDAAVVTPAGVARIEAVPPLR